MTAIRPPWSSTSDLAMNSPMPKPSAPDAVERPAVRLRHGVQLSLRLRQRDVEGRFTPANAIQQELERQRRLAGARVTFDQVDLAGRESATEDIVEAIDASSESLLRECRV